MDMAALLILDGKIQGTWRIAPDLVSHRSGILFFPCMAAPFRFNLPSFASTSVVK